MAIEWNRETKKFKRGTICWCIDKEEFEQNQNLLFNSKEKEKAKASLVLIISNDILNSNENYPYLTVLQCTSKLDDKFMPTHIETFINGVKHSIHCEKLKTVSKSRITFDVDRMSQYDMDKINRAVMITLDLKFNEVQEEKKSGIVKVDVEKLHEEIDTVKKLREDYEAHLINLEKMLHIDNPVMQMYNKSKLEKEGFTLFTPTTKRVRRSLDEIKQFIADWEDKSCVRQTVAEAYHFNSISSAYGFYYIWKKKLEQKEA